MAPDRRNAVAKDTGSRTAGAADAGASSPPRADKGSSSSANAVPFPNPDTALPTAAEPGVEDWLGEMSSAVCSAAEKRFDEKAEEIFRNAQKMLEQIDEQQTLAQQRLEDEVRRCQETNKRLEEQKDSIQQMVQQMQAQLQVAEAAALQHRATAMGSPALGAAPPPGLPSWSTQITGLPWTPTEAPLPALWGGLGSLMLPGSPPLLPGEAGPGAAAVEPTLTPTLGAACEFSMVDSLANMDPAILAAGGTGGSIGESDAIPPVISLLDLLNHSQRNQAWTIPEGALPPPPPVLGAPAMKVTPPAATAPAPAPELAEKSTSAKREATPPPKSKAAAEEEGMSTPPGLSSPDRRPKNASEDAIPYHLMSPKPKPTPRPEDYDELLTPGLRSPGPKQSHDIFAAMSPSLPRPAATPQRASAGAASRSGTPGPRVPGTPDRSQNLLLTPKRTSRSAMGNSTPMKSPVPASPFVICEGGGCVFGFMLRLAEGVDLGVDIEHGDPPDQALHVTGIVPGGAIEAWNKQCVGGLGAGKVVMRGDKIVAVNGQSEADKMLEECRQKTMLRLTVVRGDPDCTIPAPWMPATMGRRHPLGQQGQLAASQLKLLAPPGAPMGLGLGLGMEVPFSMGAMGAPFPQPPRSPGLRAAAAPFAPAAAAPFAPQAMTAASSTSPSA